MPSIAFIASAQPSASITSGKIAAPQTVAANQPQPTSRSAKDSDTVTISKAAQEALESSKTNASTFTNMTPNQMRGAAQDLFNSGKIDKQQHLMLLTTGLTIGKIGENGKYIPPTEAEIASHSNKPMNYVQYSKDRISYLESAGLTSDPQYGYESWKGLLALFQNTTSNSAA